LMGTNTGIAANTYTGSSPATFTVYPNSNYTVQVACSNSAGTATASSTFVTAAATTAPLPASTAISFVGPYTTTSMLTAWTPPASGYAGQFNAPTGYMVYWRITGNGGPGWTGQAWTTVPSYIITGLSQWVVNYDTYIVAYSNLSGPGTASAIQTNNLYDGTIGWAPAPIATAPTGFTVTNPTSYSLEVSANALPAGGQGYFYGIRQTGSGLPWTYVFLTNYGATSGYITNLAPATQYDIISATLSLGGASPFTSIVNGTTSGLPVDTLNVGATGGNVVAAVAFRQTYGAYNGPLIQLTATSGPNSGKAQSFYTAASCCPSSASNQTSVLDVVAVSNWLQGGNATVIFYEQQSGSLMTLPTGGYSLPSWVPPFSSANLPNQATAQVFSASSFLNGATVLDFPSGPLSSSTAQSIFMVTGYPAVPSSKSNAVLGNPANSMIVGTNSASNQYWYYTTGTSIVGGTFQKYLRNSAWIRTGSGTNGVSLYLDTPSSTTPTAVAQGTDAVGLTINAIGGQTTGPAGANNMVGYVTEIIISAGVVTGSAQYAYQQDVKAIFNLPA